MTEKQQAFVRFYTQTGDAHEAVRLAGYQVTAVGGIRKIAWDLRRQLAGEIKDAITTQISSHAPMAIRILCELAQDASSESVRRQAAKDLAGMAGLDIQRTETVSRDTRTDAEIIRGLSEDVRQAILDSMPDRPAKTPLVVVTSDRQQTN